MAPAGKWDTGGARAFMATPQLWHLEWCTHNTAHSQLYTVPLIKSLL